MDPVLFKPHSSLRDFIKFFVYVEFDNHGQRWWMPADLRNQLFIVHEGKPKVETADESYYHDYFALRGGFNHPLAVSFEDEKVRALVVEFTQIGISHLFGIKGSLIKNAFVPLGNLLNDKEINWFKALSNKQLNIEEFVNELDKYLAERAGDKSPKEISFNKALETAINHSGDITTETLAKETGVSEKSLLRYFKEFTGFTTKEYLNQVRFQHACKKILKTDDSNENKMKAIRGFYDQSHLINSFNKYAGTTPGKIDELDAGWVQLLLSNDIY